MAPDSPSATPPPIHRIKISDIARNPTLQVRGSVDKGTVTLYAKAMQNGAEFPPVELAFVNGMLILVDGWHRVSAREQSGNTDVVATVTPMTLPDARWRAAEANLKHGLPLKNARAYRRVFQAFMKARKWRDAHGRPLSLRAIRDHVGSHLSHNTVSNWMRKDHPSIYRSHYRKGHDEEPPPMGGYHGSHHDPEEEMANEVLSMLDSAASMARGIQNPELLGQLAERAMAVAEKIRNAQAWSDAAALPMESDDPCDF